MDREYYGNLPPESALTPTDMRKVFRASDFGRSVTEGARFGTLIQSAQAALREGTANIELNLQLGGGAEPLGPDSYGKEARQALREISKVNQVKFSATHAPTQVGNVSGFNPESGFSDQQRLFAVEEVKKAINFAADVAGGGAVVVHTGEYQRTMEGQAWNKNGEFLAYPEEPGRAIKYLVDSRTGQIQANIRKSQIYIEPRFVAAEKDGWGKGLDGQRVFVKKGDFITDEGLWIDASKPEELVHRKPVWNPETSSFETERLTWNDIEKRTKRYNDRYGEQGGKLLTPEEMAYRIQAENNILQSKGNALYYSRQYDTAMREKHEIKDALEYYQKLEKTIPKDKVWKFLDNDSRLRGRSLGRYSGDRERLPSDALKDAMIEVERNIRYIHEGAAAADARAREVQESLNFIKPMGDYAKQQSARSYAEIGIHAMHESKHPNVKRDIFAAPENIFPEMGYGSHPAELIELVQTARKEMAHLLTAKKIEDPHGHRDDKGNLIKVENPFYHGDISKKQAEELAEKHIKATFDTQHLSMWKKYFQPKFNEQVGRMETPDETDKRFNKWYRGQVDELAKSGILGHLHLVDSFGSGHQHLPAGQGIFPVVDAVKTLRAKGYKGEITSEGFGEAAYGQERIVTKVWEAFDSPIYGMGYGMGGGFGAPNYWHDVAQSYFGRIRPPNFVFGAYSPSNDWRLWTEVPLE